MAPFLSQFTCAIQGMRIIGGQWRGRRLHIPSSTWPVRPTTDFAREALFNILDNRFEYETSKALDLFGGTGIHSVELASRGCTDITYVDRYKASVKFMAQLAKEWDMPVTAVLSDVMRYLKKEKREWDYIFADPPYDFDRYEELIELILAPGTLSEHGFSVIEHISKKKLDQLPGFTESRRYGQSVFSFFVAGS